MDWFSSVDCVSCLLGTFRFCSVLELPWSGKKSFSGTSSIVSERNWFLTNITSRLKFFYDVSYYTVTDQVRMSHRTITPLMSDVVSTETWIFTQRSTPTYQFTVEYIRVVVVLMFNSRYVTQIHPCCKRSLIDLFRTEPDLTSTRLFSWTQTILL